MYFTADNIASETISRQLEAVGLAVLRDISLAELHEVATSLGHVRHHRDGLQSGLTMIKADRERSERSAGTAFTRKAMPGHTDGSGVPLPAGLVLGHCTRKASRGGQSIFADMAVIHDRLRSESPETLTVLEDEENFLFGDSELVAPIFSDHDDRVRVRFRDDGGLRIRSKRAADAVSALRELVQQHQHTLDFAEGDAYIVDNFRVLHGREAYRGDRLFGRLLVDPGSIPLGIVK